MVHARDAADPEDAVDDDGLRAFDPLVRAWFLSRFPAPTPVQVRAWREITAGRHVLVSAPTGSGKTLTAFLWALDRLLREDWRSGGVRVLYVSPLRALNNDVRRNLLEPLEELSERFRAAGLGVPAIEVRTRSGDTPPEERRRTLRRPPEILITTPESLNILLTSESGRGLLTDLETVIVDEIHAVVGSKRGVHLATAVERLAAAGAEFQRIGLSATVRPLAVVAEWLGGAVARPAGGATFHEPRDVRVVEAGDPKDYEISVRYPVASLEEGDRESDTFWEAIATDCRRAVDDARSTLVFANSRRLTERLTRTINRDEPVELVYSHHGSLSREVREAVEERFKEGGLAAIVATSSLELGIDIGALDQVVLLQTPPSVASGIQRIGRAGHGVGQVSRALFLPTHGRDLLDAAVMVPAILEGGVEELAPVEGPLDVLAQVVLSMTVRRTLSVDEVLSVLRRSWPYRRLERGTLERVLEMLAGRYAATRIRELRARLSWDRVSDTVTARPGTDRLLYLGGGTIADRGYFTLRHAETRARIGELDEEFVWERSVGDTFTLGAQSWQIRRVTHDDVLVLPARSGASLAPFWRADALDRGSAFASRVATFLRSVEGDLDRTDLAPRLSRERFLHPAAAEALVEILRSQRSAMGGRLPHRGRLVVERVRTPMGHADGRHPAFLHTLWGGTVNRPLALAARSLWEERGGAPLEVLHDDDCLLFLSDDPGLDPGSLLRDLAGADLEALLRRRLEETGFFGARFRVAASTSMLIPKSGFRHRTPLWLQRERAKKLSEAVASFGDFPILLEAWRTCLRDEMELDVLRERLQEVERGEVVVDAVLTERPSPFTANIAWVLTNQLMYESDRREKGAPVREDVLREVVFSERDRPILDPGLVEELRTKLQRTAPGYAPTSSDELRFWVGERAPLPEDDWGELLDAIRRDGGPVQEMLQEVGSRLRWWRPCGASLSSVVLAEDVGRFDAAFEVGRQGGWGLEEGPQNGPAPTGAATDGGGTRGGQDRVADAEHTSVAIVREWLSFHTCLPAERLRAVFGLGEDAVEALLLRLEEARDSVRGVRVAGVGESLVCDAENLEILLRWTRRAARPRFEARPLAELPLFLATRQGLVPRGDSIEDLEVRMEKLFGFSAPVAAWEEDLLPARSDPYYPGWLDALVSQSDLMWHGTGRERSTFVFESDLDLTLERGGDREEVCAAFSEGRPLEVEEVAERTGRSRARAVESLWAATWDGWVSHESWPAVRTAVSERFRAVEAARPRRPTRRGWARRDSTRLGRWFLLPAVEQGDALAEETRRRRRVRWLLDRYGILFRELLGREGAAFRWGELFRTLRRMELAGEVLVGQFFQGIPGLQFASPDAFRSLAAGLLDDAVWWVSAVDPASPCALGLPGLDDLPTRRSGNWVVYHGTRLVLVVERSGAVLDPRVSSEDPDAKRYLGVLKTQLGRLVRPRTSITVETIAGEPASGSAWRTVLEGEFRVTREGESLRLWKRYSGPDA